MKNTDCTILVTSCDGYLDVVGPFAALKEMYWPDCPFETVLLSETLPAACPVPTGRGPVGGAPAFDRVILTGRGKTWCQMLVEALDQIRTPYVILQMNDFMFGAKVDTELILRRLGQARTFDAANLRMVPLPPGRRPWRDTDLLEAPKDTAYCVSCQTGIWNRAYLQDLARRNKSAWEFERYGSFMVGAETRPILVTRTREYPDVDTVHKGHWCPNGVRLLKDNAIDYDFSVRGQPPPGVRFREGVKKLIFALFPWTLIVRVQNVFGVGMKERRSR